MFASIRVQEGVHPVSALNLARVRENISANAVIDSFGGIHSRTLRAYIPRVARRSPGFPFYYASRNSRHVSSFRCKCVHIP